MGETQHAPDPSHFRVPYGANQRQWKRQKSSKIKNNSRKLSKDWFSIKTAVLTHFFKVMGKTQSGLDSSEVRVPIGTDPRHSGLQRICQECQKWLKYQTLDIFKGNCFLDALFARLFKRLKIFCSHQMSGFLMNCYAFYIKKK